MIEVGEYVINQNRLVIGQIIEINEERQEAIIKTDTDKVKIPIGFWNIKKHSKNIIDLIGVGDIVNNYIVLDVMEDLQTGEIHLEMPSSYPKEGSCAIYNDEIKTILTKEQYMQNCYKIAEQSSSIN